MSDVMTQAASPHMSEDAAKQWLTDHLNVSRETFSALEAYIALLTDEMTRQNLIAPSTAPHIWARHIVDSAQLLLHTDRERTGPWLDPHSLKSL